MVVTHIARLTIALSVFALAPVLLNAREERVTAAAPLANVWEKRNATYIVQSTTSRTARENVIRVGGRARRSLDIIHAVEATLTPAQAQKLQARADVTLYPDRRLAPFDAKTTSSGALPDGTAVSQRPDQYVPDFPMLVGATSVQQMGITGRGVTI